MSDKDSGLHSLNSERSLNLQGRLGHMRSDCHVKRHRLSRIQMGEEGLEDLQVIREKENKEGLNDSSTLENRMKSSSPG